jgi:hypothetical protein
MQWGDLRNDRQQRHLHCTEISSRTADRDRDSDLLGRCHCYSKLDRDDWFPVHYICNRIAESGCSRHGRQATVLGTGFWQFEYIRDLECYRHRLRRRFLWLDHQYRSLHGSGDGSTERGYHRRSKICG